MKFCITAIFILLFFAAAAQESVPNSIYDFKFAAAKQGTIDLSAYKGKKILIVNGPEQGDNARQYTELEALYQKYKGKLVIIGVLANDFAIEPGSNKGSMLNREKNYRVTYPLAAHQVIRGPQMSSLYKWLTEKKYNNLMDSEIKWDFQKYLINESGVMVAEFDPKIKADDPRIITAIEQ